jgi:hypothetical protein
MTSSDSRTISTNILQVIDAKKVLFDELESELKSILFLLFLLLNIFRKDVAHQEIGATFLKNAITIKDLLFSYCANHPLVMALIVKKR